MKCSRAVSAYRQVICMYTIVIHTSFSAIADVSDDMIDGKLLQFISLVFALLWLDVSFSRVPGRSVR